MKYEVCVVVFDTITEGDCEEIINATYWQGKYGLTHPFEREFDSLDEARKWASTFDAAMARRALSTGNGTLYAHVGIDVVVRHEDETEDYAVSTYSWYWGTELDVWHEEDVADEILPAKED